MKQINLVDPEASTPADELRAELAACHQTIQRLQTRNQQLQLVLDSMPQNIFWKDRDLVYQGCNHQFAAVAGVSSPEEIIGKSDYELRWTAAADAFRAFDRQVMKSDQAQLAVVESLAEINEQFGWVATSKIPLHDSTGEVIGILGLFEDITERAKEEEALRQSEAQLRRQTQELRQALHALKRTQTQLVQAEKMSSLGQLVAGIAHEINNPVGFIHGNLCHAREHTRDLLDLIALYQQQCPQPSTQLQKKLETVDLEFLQADLPRLFSSMQTGAERIRQIVLSLRIFSRLDEADLKAIDLHEGIDSTLLVLQSQLKGQLHSPIQIMKDYGSLPLVECYAGQLNQVIMNLLSNAIDAVEEKRLLELEAHLAAQIWDAGSPSPFSPTIWIKTQIKGDRVEIRIIDNGIGMSKEVASQIFNPFFTTKPPGKGTGLGLSISYQIITEKHNGSLTCSSQPGQGAEFVIDIPVEQSWQGL